MKSCTKVTQRGVAEVCNQDGAKDCGHDHVCFRHSTRCGGIKYVFLCLSQTNTENLILGRYVKET